MAQTRTLLVVDDDADLRGALAEQLELEDFRVVQAGAGEAGFALAQAERPDLLILDVDLPDTDGRDLCRRLREAGIAAPVIMLTGAAGDVDAIRGLDSGADDYVTKPFRFAVLLARIRAHLRTHEHSDAAVFRIGPYTFHPAQKVLLEEGGRRVRLTEKETSILKYLYRKGGVPVGREELLSEVWGYNSEVSTHTLETHVYRLRRKVEPPGAEKVIVFDGGGYKLAG